MNNPEAGTRFKRLDLATAVRDLVNPQASISKFTTAGGKLRRVAKSVGGFLRDTALMGFGRGEPVTISAFPGIVFKVDDLLG